MTPKLNNFKLLDIGLNVGSLFYALKRQPHLWDEITIRQKYDGTAHAHTQTIFLRWCEEMTLKAAFTDIEAIDYPAYSVLPEAKKLVDEVLKQAESNELGRVIITSLDPESAIDPHVDEGVVAAHYERFHIPIFSQTNNHFYCEDEVVEMLPGDLWCFNNKKKHWVTNGSKRERIHLIVDCVSPKYREALDEVF